MDNYEWYVNLMNYLDKKAKANQLLNRIEIEQLNICIDRYSLADSAQELISDIADANDCGICKTWNDLISALSKLHKSGDRIEIN